MDSHKMNLRPILEQEKPLFPKLNTDVVLYLKQSLV